MKSVHIRLPKARHITAHVPDVIDRFARAPVDAEVGEFLPVEDRRHRIIEVHETYVVVVPA